MFFRITLDDAWVRFELVLKVNWPLKVPSKGFIVVGAHELKESTLSDQAV